MTRLPPVFAARRLALPPATVPPIVIHFSEEHLSKARDALDEISKGKTAQQLFYRHWWCEFGKTGLLCLSTDQGDALLHDITIFKRKGQPYRFRHRHDDQNTPDLLDRLPPIQGTAIAVLQLCTYALHLFSNAPLRRSSTDTLIRAAPAAYRQEGDTLRFTRLHSLAEAHCPADTYERPRDPSGIKMRAHDVRGHWRTYKSGIRVWVRSHTRGDPALGRVQRIITGETTNV